MDDATERAVTAILAEMVRDGTLATSTIAHAADRMDGEGDGDGAHAARCIAVEAMAPTASDWNADKRRSRFRVVPVDGGNQPD